MQQHFSRKVYHLKRDVSYFIKPKGIWEDEWMRDVLRDIVGYV